MSEPWPEASGCKPEPDVEPPAACSGPFEWKMRLKKEFTLVEKNEMGNLVKTVTWRDKVKDHDGKVWCLLSSSRQQDGLVMEKWVRFVAAAAAMWAEVA